ncbi:MAG: CoA transferase [Deltaproteobacteria bacterium]|nr:CoA transferase [Deltaproteobacteria bacterium]
MSESASIFANALRGIRILDFTRVLAGPYSTRVLADFGAEVIKIQSKRTARGAESNGNAYFKAWNRGKLSITLNMEMPEARDLFTEILKISDIVIENYSPRVMKNWDIEYDRLKEIKSDIIMLSMSAAGHTGPWKDLVAFAPTIHSLSGMTYLTSFCEGSPSGPGFAYSDIIAGLYGVFSILSALEYREKTGKGLYIDLSEYEAMSSVIGPAVIDEFAHCNLVAPSGNSPCYVTAAPHGCYKCSGENEFCVIAVFSESEWRALCDVLGNPTWTNEERFSSMEKRLDNNLALDQMIQEWTKSLRAEEVVKRLQGAKVPAGIVQDAKDLADDPQLKSRNFFIDIEHPSLGATKTDTYPVLFNGRRVKTLRPPPLLGEDNDYVYKNLLGLNPEEIQSYIKREVIY